ncbi:MAG: diadenosine tetraphosphate hydrolase [Rhodobacteraceae bacterium]|nr:diadenosine tetraphosphate hydrolase [Paracoccaceae bacterium]|eukprot:jgi/Tetstr1/437102/TSEL_025862.t1
MSDFTLDDRLAGDSLAVLDLDLCTVRLMNDARYPWLLLVPMRADVTELVDLGADDRLRLIEEIAGASKALKAVSGCDKLNVGALGNMVPQLHVHIVARFVGDAAWPGPVWGAGAAEPYPDGAGRELAERLSQAVAREIQ